jgi:uncharacterized membrane protein
MARSRIRPRLKDGSLRSELLPNPPGDRDWTAFAAATSNIPFAAIVQSRNALVPRELALPLLVGFAAYGLVLWGHRFVSGVSIV